MTRSAGAACRTVPVSIRQHTSAYVSIRQHTSAYVRRVLQARRVAQYLSSYVSIRQHTSAYVSIRQTRSAGAVCRTVPVRVLQP
jgi:hypothetical protein